MFNSLRLQRLKLFHRLESCGIDDRCTSLTRDCCSLELFPEDVEIMDDAIVSVSADFSPELEAALFYVSGYKQKKFGLPAPPESVPMDSPSEFTTFLSRGRLKYPSEDVSNSFDFVTIILTWCLHPKNAPSVCLTFANYFSSFTQVALLTSLLL